MTAIQNFSAFGEHFVCINGDWCRPQPPNRYTGEQDFFPVDCTMQDELVRLYRRRSRGSWYNNSAGRGR